MSKFQSLQTILAQQNNSGFSHFAHTAPTCSIVYPKEETVNTVEPIEPEKEKKEVVRISTPDISLYSIYGEKEEKIEFQKYVVLEDTNKIVSIIEIDHTVFGKHNDVGVEEKKDEAEEQPKIKKQPSLRLLVEQIILNKKIEKNGWKI